MKKDKHLKYFLISFWYFLILKTDEFLYIHKILHWNFTFQSHPGQVTLTHEGALKGKANYSSGSLTAVEHGGTQELNCYFLSREVSYFMGIHVQDVVEW